MYIIIFNCKVILYLLSNRFHVAVRLFCNRSQMTSKCGKNKKVAHEAIAKCVTDVCECVTGHYGGPQLPRQNLLFHGKTCFLTAKLTFSWQNLLFHGKTYISTGKLSFFLTAKLTFPRQNLPFHAAKLSFFLTAKLTFPRQNLLF